ncbi:MAG TPA: hypothetical protein PLK77_00010 [Pyrinomonadaceae bacterium]|nr:hypothetical protein [Pyrinomonadaceae bacterium]
MTTVRIDYASEDFPAGSIANGAGVINTTWDDILWSAVTVGRPNRSYVFRHGTASAYEALFRWSLTRMAIEQRGPAGQRLWRTDAARTLDPSEKGAVNYFLGMTFCKLFASALLDTPWLLHLDVFRPMLDPVLTGRSRPDMVGKTTVTGKWHAFESKGRASVPNDTAKDKAKEQAERLVKVDGVNCDLHIGAITYFRNNILNFYWRDPEPRTLKTIEVVESDQAWGHYYAPVVGLLNDRRDQRHSTDGRTSLRIEEADLEISIHPDIQPLLMNGEWLRTHHLCLELQGLLLESGYKPDGISIKAGETWSRRFRELSGVEG